MSLMRVEKPKPPTFRLGMNGFFCSVGGGGGIYFGGAFLFSKTNFSTSSSSCVFPFSFISVDMPRPPTFNEGMNGAFLVITEGGAISVSV